MNTFQKTTATGKPIYSFNKKTKEKSPVFKYPSSIRIKELKEEILGFKITKNLTNDQRFALIQLENITMVKDKKFQSF